MPKKKMKKWQKVLLGLGCLAGVGLLISGFNLFVKGGMITIYMLAGSACLSVVVSVVLIVKDVVKDGIYEYVDDYDDEYEEDEEYLEEYEEEYEKTVDNKSCLRLVEIEDIVLQEKYKENDILDSNIPPKLEIVNPGNGYTRKRKK